MSARADFIRRRADALMLDPTSAVELMEELQEAGGPANEFFAHALRRICLYRPGSPMWEYGHATAHMLLRTVAEDRAAREYLNLQEAAA